MGNQSEGQGPKGVISLLGGGATNLDPMGAARNRPGRQPGQKARRHQGGLAGARGANDRQDRNAVPHPLHQFVSFRAATEENGRVFGAKGLEAPVGIAFPALGCGCFRWSGGRRRGFSLRRLQPAGQPVAQVLLEQAGELAG